MVLKGYVDRNGRMVLPRELTRLYGLNPGSEFIIDEAADELTLLRPISSLNKIYLEPTNQCNLNCRTCIRNVWDAQLGLMQAETFERVLAGIEELPSTPIIFFGGYGEPLLHPEILSMLREAKRRGARVELITNGTLLTEEIVHSLIDMNMDFLWVSLDGATPEDHSNIRGGNEFADILKNLENLHRQRLLRSSPHPEIGISFVAMKKNLKNLRQIINIGLNIRTSKLSISNVLPHTKALKEERLYEKSGSGWGLGYLELSFPRMDVDDLVASVIKDLVFWSDWHGLVGQPRERRRNRCPFVRRGSMSIRFDGRVSPCQPLMYSHCHYLDDTLRQNTEFFVGSVLDDTILNIWQRPEYFALRQRLSAFDFSPCTECNSCELAEHNQKDCFQNNLPACGGCLWAQGFINCP